MSMNKAQQNIPWTASISGSLLINVNVNEAHKETTARISLVMWSAGNNNNNNNNNIIIIIIINNNNNNNNNSNNSNQISPCEEFYLEEDVEDRPVVLLLLAVGFDACRDLVQRCLLMITPKKKQVVKVAQRRHQILNCRTILRPGKNWNVNQVMKWLQKYPIEGERERVCQAYIVC